MFEKFVPINDNILVELKPKENKSTSGIIIPSDAQEKNQAAIVVHPGKSTQLKVGDQVYCKKYIGHNLNDTYMVIREEDILGVL